ncbi:unnamed protein product, partial [Scytosiphon promiscuus]
MSRSAQRRNVLAVLGMKAGAIRLFLLATTATNLLQVVRASTSLPSSSSELCPGETGACYDSPLCWACVAQFSEDSSDFCRER